jgi:hypothetical protein
MPGTSRSMKEDSKVPMGREVEIHAEQTTKLSEGKRN